MGFSSPQKAEAKDWLHTYKSGYFTNYVINTYHPKFTKTTKKYSLRAVTFKSNSKGKGTYKIYVQKASQRQRCLENNQNRQCKEKWNDLF